jgi:hypothetical protein
MKQPEKKKLKREPKAALKAGAAEQKPVPAAIRGILHQAYRNYLIVMKWCMQHPSENHFIPY